MSERTEDALRRFQKVLERSLVEDRDVDMRMAVEFRAGDHPFEGMPPDPSDGRPTWDDVLAEHERSTVFERGPLRLWGTDFQDINAGGLFRGELSGALFVSGGGDLAASNFIQRAVSLESLARAHLKNTGAGLELWAEEAAGWFLIVCRLALAHGVLCPYRVVARWAIDSGPLDRHERYEVINGFLDSWGSGKWPPPGLYVIAPTDDARSASIEAIELLLKMEKTAATPRPKNRNADRDRFACEQERLGTTRGEILRQIQEKGWGEIAESTLRNILKKCDDLKPKRRGRPKGGGNSQ